MKDTALNQAETKFLAHISKKSKSEQDKAIQLLDYRSNFAGKDKELGFYYPEFNGMVFIGKKDQYFVAMAFKNRQRKPVFHYLFRSHEHYQMYVEKWYKDELKEIEAKEQRKREEKRFKAENPLTKLIKMGDVFISTWGYEQTNVNYYQVVGFKGKTMLLLREINGIAEETGYLTGNVVPAINDFANDKIIIKRANVNNHRGQPLVTVGVANNNNAVLKHRNSNGEYTPDIYSSYH